MSVVPRNGATTMSSSGADHSSTPMPKSVARRPRRGHERHEATDDAADTERRGEQTDTGLPHVEQLEGDADLVDQRGTGDDGLRRHQGGDEAQVAATADRAEAGRRLTPDAERLVVDHVGAVIGGSSSATSRRPGREPDEERRRHDERQRVDEVDDRHVGDGEEQAPSAGPAKNPTASIVEATTLALVSSRGSVASSGSSDAWAGRNASESTAGQQTGGVDRDGGPSAAISTAPTTMTAARLRSEPIITSRRSWRSASVANSGPSNAIET